MKQKIWAKTLLATYNSLETISNAIDNLVIAQGVNSGRNSLSVMENANKIINFIQRKKNLINLKVIVENCIASLDNTTARILVLKYFDKIKPEICMELLEMSRRTYFRKLDKAIDTFANKLKYNGYTVEVLENMLKKEYWIKDYFSHYSKQILKDDFNEENAVEEEFNNCSILLKKCEI